MPVQATIAVDVGVSAKCLDCGAPIENWERLNRRPRDVVFKSDDGRTVHVRKKLACVACYGERVEITMRARTS